MKENAVSRANAESGFSLFEVLISVGLIIFTLSLSINALIGMVRIRHKAAARSTASVALDNFLNGLRAASSYDETLRTAGLFPSSFVLVSDVKGKRFDCTSAVDSVNFATINFTCKRNDGDIIRRVFIASAVALAPGAVLTPAATDIIRLHVSTESPMP